MLDLGPALDGLPSTETHDKASTSRQHGKEDVLSKMLPRLSHMDLTGHVSNKDAAMEAHGGYCDVFVGHVASKYICHRCIIPPGVREVKVAIKRLRVRLGKYEKLAKSLAREMGIWSRLTHPNILPLLGYLIEKDYPSLISEWIENGTIKSFVKNNPECDITHLALGIARGLEYMHGMDVVHSDMKADNVLINQSGEPLICDFGISRMLNSSETLFVSTTHDGSPKGSIRWMTKELLMSDGGADPKHTKETDVWAYGMTLFEIITKKVPYAHYRNDAQVLLAIVKGELPARPPAVDAQSSLIPLWSICTRCWKDQPEARATVAQIIEQLQSSSSSVFLGTGGAHDLMSLDGLGMVLESDLLPTILMTTPTLHKGQHGPSFAGASTLKLPCDQCFAAILLCDGTTPCFNCVRRKSQCTAIYQKAFPSHEDNENRNWQNQNQGQGSAMQLGDVSHEHEWFLDLTRLGGISLSNTGGTNSSNNFLSPDYGFSLADTNLRRVRGERLGHRRSALSEQAQESVILPSDISYEHQQLPRLNTPYVPPSFGPPVSSSTGIQGVNLFGTGITNSSNNFLSPDFGLGLTATDLRRSVHRKFDQRRTDN